MLRSWRLWGGTAITALALAAGMLGAVPSTAATTVAGPVSPVPQTQTPHLISTGPLAQIRQLVQCGSTMYAVGSFTQIKRNSTTYTRDNVFSFSATSPFKVTSWTPDVNGVVNSITFNGGNCADAYIGGKFSAVGGTTVKDIAEISTSTGSVVTAFGAHRVGSGRDAGQLPGPRHRRRLFHLDQRQRRGPLPGQPEQDHRQGRRPYPT